MKEITGMIKEYYHGVNKPTLALCTLFISGLVWLNYRHHLEYALINKVIAPFPTFTGHFLIYLAAFLIPHIILLLNRKKNYSNHPGFWICLFAAPVIFAIKVSMNTNLYVSANTLWNNYWNDIIYWPLRMIVLVAILILCRKLFHKNEALYGLSAKKINYAPYLVMLLIMIPLIAAASTQPDFLAFYPKMKMVLPLPEGANPNWFYKLLFQLSYGSDFISVEIFFRGFLIIGFMKWVGKDAILPMACFYCTIHFGKPLGECISSYFGGLLLGIISYHTKSIYGGLMVHLGIAWLMEVGGYLGNKAPVP
ncbi:MAG: CPBP family glutamic-type intramembrane protease [Chitinophagaceae bacterium]